MSSDPKQPTIDVSQLQYYFDSVERDSLDRMSHSRRSSEVLAIRDKLLTLPDKDFEAAVQTIKNILNPNAKPDTSEEQKAKRKEATELYDTARTEKPLTSLKAGTV